MISRCARFCFLSVGAFCERPRENAVLPYKRQLHFALGKISLAPQISLSKIISLAKRISLFDAGPYTKITSLAKRISPKQKISPAVWQGSSINQCFLYNLLLPMRLPTAHIGVSLYILEECKDIYPMIIPLLQGKQACMPLQRLHIHRVPLRS